MKEAQVLLVGLLGPGGIEPFLRSLFQESWLQN
jgi:hypothetical protein